jgi:signal transduction histidine kinase
MLRVVIDETDRLNVVVSQFLDYARPFELDISVDHVNALVTYVLSLLRAQGIPAGVDVHERLAGDLPPIRVDRTRLSQVLLNLYQNALQAMPEGGTLTVTTRIHTHRTGRLLMEIAVSDTGGGVRAEDLEKLFIPFFTTKRDGTGLGLAICQRIVQAHGGELDVQTSPGRGATFLVRLPIPPPVTEETGEIPDQG